MRGAFDQVEQTDRLGDDRRILDPVEEGRRESPE
jgi:hypothetical protein